MTELKTELYYKLHTWYSVTINPNDNSQHIDGRTTYLTRIDDVQSDFHKNCRKLHDNGIQFRFSLDLSEPHQNLRINSSPPRLHYHGRVLFSSKRSFLFFQLSWLPRMMENHLIDIDTISDIKKWDLYCDKCLHLFEDLSVSPRYDIPYTNKVIEELLKIEQKYTKRSIQAKAETQATYIQNFFPRERAKESDIST